MSFLKKKIKRLRKISLYLFLLPTIALIASLLIHNVFMGFKFKSADFKYNISSTVKIQCNSENFFCESTEPYAEYTYTFENCEKNKFHMHVFLDDKNYKHDLYVENFFSGEKYDGPSDEGIFENLSNFYMTTVKNNNINHSCILNSNLFNLYKIVPGLFYFIEKIKLDERYKPGTSGTVNPFIYGEASISNIVKRYPVDLFFKPLLYVSSILMILYWIHYNIIFRNIIENQKISKFTIFGVASSLFLFFHVFFLGTTIENDIFTKIRKIILLLFILCEILAQFFLVKRLYLSFEKIDSYVYKYVIKLKMILVSITVLTTFVVLVILSFYDLDPKVDYILEWNYFLFLLVFYFLSAIMWRKKN